MLYQEKVVATMLVFLQMDKTLQVLKNLCPIQLQIY